MCSQNCDKKASRWSVNRTLLNRRSDLLKSEICIWPIFRANIWLRAKRRNAIRVARELNLVLQGGNAPLPNTTRIHPTSFQRSNDSRCVGAVNAINAPYVKPVSISLSFGL